MTQQREMSMWMDCVVVTSIAVVIANRFNATSGR